MTAGQQAFSGLIAGWAWRGPGETRGRAADLTGQYRFRLGREGGGVDAGGACPSVDCMVGAGQGTPAAVPPALTRHRTAQPFPNVASASGAAVGGWSPRRASAGESGRRLCKATDVGVGRCLLSLRRSESQPCFVGTPRSCTGTPGRGPLTRSGAPLLPSAGRGGRSASLSHLLDLMWFLFLFPVTYDTLLQSPGNSPR